MSPLFTLAILAMFMAAGVARSSRRQPTIGWSQAAWATLALGIVGVAVPSDAAQAAAVAVAGLGLLAPGIGFALARRAAGRGRYGRAARIAGMLAALRRSPQMRRWHAAWSAVDAFYAGDAGPVERLRDHLRAEGDPSAELLVAWLAMATRAWPDLLHSPAIDAQSRALCELGEVDRGIELAGRSLGRRLSWNSLKTARYLWLAPLAFAGRVPGLLALCRLLRLDRDSTTLWHATGLAAAGESAAATRALDGLLARTDLPAPLRAAAWQRRAALPGPRPLGVSARDILASAELEVQAGLSLRGRPWWREPATLLILAGVAVGFALQIERGGSLNPFAAWSLGALRGGTWPTDPVRLFAYGFLHFGVMHLAVNALVIAVLAPMVASALGTIGLAIVYGGAVVGGGVGIALVGSDGLTVGASGGAMGLLGAVLVILWRHPALRGTATGEAGRRFALGIVLIQAVFDGVMAEVSFAGHAAGLVSGALLALAWLLVGRVGSRPVPRPALG
ncbi:MAG: rhomboid family intramembrane serine protease [bacterium]